MKRNEGDNKEKMIRRWFVERNVIEAVILLPENFFYRTTAAENNDIQAIFDALAGLDGEAKPLDGNLEGIFEGLGYSLGAKP